MGWRLLSHVMASLCFHITNTKHPTPPLPPRHVKLYFMIGLPGETDADVLGIAETVAWLQRECRRGRQHLAVSITVSNFTPKPHTPFQWHRRGV